MDERRCMLFQFVENLNFNLMHFQKIGLQNVAVNRRPHRPSAELRSALILVVYPRFCNRGGGGAIRSWAQSKNGRPIGRPLCVARATSGTHNAHTVSLSPSPSK